MALATGDVLRLGNRSLRFAAGLGPEDPGGEAAAPVAD
jgi:hypothetical protein